MGWGKSLTMFPIMSFIIPNMSMKPPDWSKEMEHRVRKQGHDQRWARSGSHGLHSYMFPLSLSFTSSSCSSSFLMNRTRRGVLLSTLLFLYAAALLLFSLYGCSDPMFLLLAALFPPTFRKQANITGF